ncbi:MAG: hypothetical protein ACOYMR_00895 [Ilumatobacteraceae bacterium]
MKWKAVAVALLATTAFVAFGHGDAAALFAATANGPALASAQSVPPTTAPTVSAFDQAVTVSWPAATLSGGTPATGYVVRRYNLSNVVQTVLPACSAVTGTSCVEQPVPIGTWRYSVQPVLGTWTGPESPKSAAITVAVAGFAITSAQPIVAVPATVTGTIVNFTLGASLTYRLDSVSGAVLAGSPATVTNSSSTSVSVTLPAGTTDDPHSIFVVDSSGKVASAAIDIVIPPAVQTVDMRDVDGNGKVDRVVVTFDQALNPAYSAGVAPWTLANVPSGGTLSSVAVSGSTATLTIAEGLGAASTAVGAFTVALAADAGGIRDVANHTASFTARAPADAAAPAVVSIVQQDVNANGRIDRVTATFSEALAVYGAGTTPWTLANVPSGGSLASVTVTSPTVTLALTEGAAAIDTAVGSFTVSLAANAAGIRDAAGNRATFTRAPSDGAAPIRRTQEMFDDDRDGRVDRVRVTFSETLAPFTGSASVFSLAAAPSGATVGSVVVSGAATDVMLVEGTGTPNTAVGSFTVTLAASPSGVRDAAGNQSTFTAVAPTDRAAPALRTLTLLDSSGNGRVDRVTALFSERLTTYGAGTTPWTLANVPSGGTLSSVSLATATITLTLTEGAGAIDTTVGSMTVAMVANATGVRDAGGNPGSFTATTPIDGARPVATAVVDTNGTTNGLTQPGDTIAITFSEPLDPGSVPASSTLTVSDPVGNGNDTLTISGITSGARSMGSNNYLSSDGGVAAFAASPLTLSNANRTVTVTVGPMCSGTGCAFLTAPTTTPNFSYLAATTLRDTAANAPITSARSFGVRLF